MRRGIRSFDSHARNLLDLTAMRSLPSWGRQEGDFDDGRVGTAPVGSYRANAFGMHDVHGNVAEWCEEAPVSYELPVRSGDGLRVAGRVGSSRLMRGGTFHAPASRARSGDRERAGPNGRYRNVGVRPARRLH